MGAKQNRVSQHLRLPRAGARDSPSPVSCTEHGRWRYVAERFSDSGYVAAGAVRRAAHESVAHATCVRMGDFQSDQGEVWNQVALLHDRHGVYAPRLAPCARFTSSARDGSAFCQATFKAQPGQSGLLALLQRQGRGARRPGNAGGLRTAARTPSSAPTAIDALVESGSTGADDLRTAKEFLVSLSDVAQTVHEVARRRGEPPVHRFGYRRIEC